MNSTPVVSVTIPAGTKGWFLQKYNGADVATFEHDTPVTVTEYSETWVQTINRVPGFPIGHQPILIHNSDLPDYEV